jgi:hypothetical protein
MFNFVSCFQRFQIMIIYSYCFALAMRQNTIAKSPWWSKAAHLMVVRKQKGGKKGPGIPIFPLKTSMKTSKPGHPQ